MKNLNLIRKWANEIIKAHNDIFRNRYCQYVRDVFEYKNEIILELSYSFFVKNKPIFVRKSWLKFPTEEEVKMETLNMIKYMKYGGIE